MSKQDDTPGGEVLVYEAVDGSAQVNVRLEHDTVWLTQRQMSELFETTPENVLMHPKDVSADGELEEGATAKDVLVVRTEGNLLYLVIKDHPFSDGNKRIGSFLFMLYLKQEDIAHALNPSALTALALLIAESSPASKDLMIRLIMNLLVERHA